MAFRRSPLQVRAGFSVICPPCGNQFTNVDPRVKTCSRSCGRHEVVARAHERRNRIVQLSRQGLANSTIADKLSVTVRTVERARSSAGLAQPAQRYGTEDEKLQAKIMLADGCSYAEVARTIGRCDDTVAKWHPGYQFTKAQTGLASALSRRMKQLEKSSLTMYAV